MRQWFLHSYITIKHIRDSAIKPLFLAQFAGFVHTTAGLLLFLKTVYYSTHHDALCPSRLRSSM